MDFKKSDTLAKLKANIVGFKFWVQHHFSKNEYEIEIRNSDCRLKYVQDDSEPSYHSIESAIERIEDGIWTVLKTSSEHPHADIIRAYADGAKIQWSRDNDQFWQDIEYPSFMPKHSYRIRPETKKLYKVVLYAGVDRYVESNGYYANLDVFKDQNPQANSIGIDMQKYIEVLKTDPDYT